MLLPPRPIARRPDCAISLMPNGSRARRKAWALPLSIVIALATLLIALLFLYHILVGEAYEMRTVVALGLRTGVWGVIALALYRRQK